ncbi:MAG: tetratricopeptide repeat protein [Bryobacterales bacterium]|nr:tetratricopeptide repeat protein [Bryobacterales bacterium]
MDLTQGTLTQALEHHQAGRLAEAERMYREILARRPRHPDALHLLGALAGAAGRHDEALALIGQAIQASPTVAAFHNSLGLALQSQGRHCEAGLCFAQALSLAPGFVEAHVNFGNSLQSLGLLQEAAAQYQAALRSRPDCAEAHNNLGNALLAGEDAPAAEACFREALRLRPDYAAAWVNLSGALQRQQRPEEAQRCCLEAVRLAPEMSEAYSNLAAIWSAAGRFDEAEALAREAIRRKPDLAEAWTLLSVAHSGRGRYAEAERCARRSLELRPGYAEAWNNLGNALQEQDRFEEAEACYRESLRLKPRLAEAHYNLGNLRRQKLRLSEAAGCYREAIRLNPGHAKAHWNLSLTLLAAGELERGWEEFEWRWKNPKTPPRGFPQPLWDGASLEGRTILLHAEQGLGDTIQFIRYAELAKAAGAAVVVECPAKLGPLVASAPGVDRVVEAGAPLPPFDVQAPLMSLPRILRTSPERIPARVPYLSVDPDRRRRWEARLAGAAGFRVGLAWKGNPEHPEDRFRSAGWDVLQPLSEIRDVAWYSLQHGGRPGVFPGGKVTDLAPETKDFRDAAGAIEQMDLVITVDSVMAHLAGALGRPVWVLLAHLPDWRWMLERQTSPWYPTARLFRQPERGDWESVIESVGEALIQERSKAANRERYAL